MYRALQARQIAILRISGSWYTVYMSKFSTVLTLLLLISVVGGGVFLAFWDIPPPTREVEKEIPHARFD